MADDAYLWLPEVSRGITLGWGALPRLVNLVGPAKAKQLIIFGEKISAQSAIQLGLVDWTAPKGHAREIAMHHAQKVASLPVVPVAMTKEAVNACASVMTVLASHMEADQANFLRIQRAKGETS